MFIHTHCRRRSTGKLARSTSTASNTSTGSATAAAAAAIPSVPRADSTVAAAYELFGVTDSTAVETAETVASKSETAAEAEVIALALACSRCLACHEGTKQLTFDHQVSAYTLVQSLNSCVSHASLYHLWVMTMIITVFGSR
jgi:mono/diheme cytochrome c family protein